MLSADELKSRLPVWLALSDFFVDTEFDARHWSINAAVLAESPYTLPELDRILREEVAPVAAQNIAYGIYPVISPVWAGFDAEWLREAITNHLSRNPIPGFVERALVWTSMHALRAQWEALQREIETLRHPGKADSA